VVDKPSCSLMCYAAPSSVAEIPTCTGCRLQTLTRLTTCTCTLLSLCRLQGCTKPPPVRPPHLCAARVGRPLHVLPGSWRTRGSGWHPAASPGCLGGPPAAATVRGVRGQQQQQQQQDGAAAATVRGVRGQQQQQQQDGAAAATVRGVRGQQQQQQQQQQDGAAAAAVEGGYRVGPSFPAGTTPLHTHFTSTGSHTAHCTDLPGAPPLRPPYTGRPPTSPPHTFHHLRLPQGQRAQHMQRHFQLECRQGSSDGGAVDDALLEPPGQAAVVVCSGVSSSTTVSTWLEHRAERLVGGACAASSPTSITYDCCGTKVCRVCSMGTHIPSRESAKCSTGLLAELDLRRVYMLWAIQHTAACSGLPQPGTFTVLQLLEYAGCHSAAQQPSRLLPNVTPPPPHPPACKFQHAPPPQHKHTHKHALSPAWKCVRNQERQARPLEGGPKQSTTSRVPGMVRQGAKPLQAQQGTGTGRRDTHGGRAGEEVVGRSRPPP
jgi:hypothetical protein